MSSPNAAAVAAPLNRTWMVLGLVLLVAGFFGHFFAARGIGGSYVAYRDHIVGFTILTVASLIIVGLLGWRFWKGRRDVTILTVGVIQAILGLVIYIERFHV